MKLGVVTRGDTKTTGRLESSYRSGAGCNCIKTEQAVTIMLVLAPRVVMIH